MTAQANQATAAGDAKDLEAKETIHAKIRDMVKAKTGSSIGLSGGKEIFDEVVKEIFESAVKEGNFRFPAGFGSLKVVTVAAGKKTLPNGRTVNAPERKKVRLDMGTAIRARLQG